MTSLETTDGVTLGYRVQGSGPPLLFVHGWMTSGDLWSPTLATLADRFTCVVPDLRGTGASSSDTADYSLQRQAKDLVELLDHLDLHDVVVVGHSMGGPIACGVAIGAPARVRCLVLTNPVPFDGLDLPDEIVALFRTSAGNRDKQGAILDAASPHLHDDERTRLLDVAGPIPEPCIVGAFDAWTGGAFGERAAEIQVPALVVATSDPFLPPPFLRQAVVDRLPHAGLAHVPGPGHYLPVEQPAVFAALIEAFVTGTPSTGTRSLTPA